MPLNKEILLAPGEVLYREGDPNDCWYIIESGEVLMHSSATGSRINYERRGTGSVMGELSILTGRPLPVTVEAITPCRIFRISATQLLDRFEKLDPVLRGCIDTSISFSAKYNAQVRADTFGYDESTDYATIPLVPSTLRNASEVIAKLRMEADIVKGLQQNQFSLVYQPIVRLEDGGIVGVEALMRWQHPSLGNVPPDRFIRLAEEVELIGQLTEFALSEAASAFQRMQAKDPSTDDFFVSVNISGQDIIRNDFIDFVTFLIDRHDMRPDTLKLELTETALVSDPELAEKNLGRLRQLGCGISVDDFGTGYSNLAYLKSLPLTALKIDRAFAGDAHANAISRGIVRMLLGLGKEMGLEIIAEGVETNDDVKALQSLGCHIAQGFHFHRPMPEAEILDLIARGAASVPRVA